MRSQSIYCCPKSKSKLIKIGNEWKTEDGRYCYPILNDISILIKDYEEHLEKIALLKKSHKCTWYTDEQVRYTDFGPYRHHYNRRRTIVRNLLRMCIYEKSETDNKPMSFLDMGCGDGGTSRWLIDEAPSNSIFYLTDYNFERLMKAKELLKGKNVEFSLSDITHIPILENSIDIVFSNHVIEHIPDDLAVFENAFRVLRPDGHLLLGCPNEGVFWWLLAYALSPSSLRNSDHIHFYDSYTLIEMGRKLGFEDCYTEHVGYGIPHWGLDGKFRRYKFLDDVFHYVGKGIIPRQASSLYILFRKPSPKYISK